MNTPFIIERLYNAPLPKVWKAITEVNDMRQWYFNLKDFKPEVGFEFTFTGEGREGEKYIHLCKITEVVPNRKITYSWSYENYQGFSYVTFELFAEGDKTRLKLTHEGIESFPPNNPSFTKESFADGWTELIGSLLKDFVER